MKDNQPYKIHEPVSSSAILPLDDFFAALRNNGIGVTPAQIITANKIILQFGAIVPNEAAICDYLCPVFATNETEQIRFKEIFAQFYKPVNENVTGVGPEDEKTHLKKHWWKYLVLLLTAGFFIWYYGRDPINPPGVTLTVNITGQNIRDAYSNNNSSQFVTGDTLQATISAASGDSNKVKYTILRATYNWGDNTPAETTGLHVYNSTGIYTTRVFVKAYYKRKLIKSDTIISIIKVCNFKNGLTVSIPAVNDSVAVNKTVLLTAAFENPDPPVDFKWTIQLAGDTGIKAEFSGGAYKEWTFTSEGQYTISCQAIYDSIEGPCTYSTTKLIYAFDPLKPQISATIQTAPAAKPIKAVYTVKPFWYWLLGAGLLVFIFLAAFLDKLFKKLQRRQATVPMPDKDYLDMLASFDSKEAPGDMPFLNKNYLALAEPALTEAARYMRRRIEGDAAYMNVQKTISRAIKNAGFFLPVLSRRTQQSEFLVLIDENHINNQQVKLFDYLTDMLRRHNVFIDIYYYRYEPSLCYSNISPNGISLEKLSEKYPRHVLLIFGHGYQLVYQYQPVISNSYLHLLNRWQYKAILTPISLLDWDVKEKSILQEALPVFPVDAEGLLLLMQALFDGKADALEELKQHAKDFYETETVDFEDIGELADYCQHAAWGLSADSNRFENLLFQWIAALALYPRIQWELTLSIGKSLLDKAGLEQELNFTNLLRIARIKWMKEGAMPSEIRLALLKKLTRRNEELARKTILAALEEIPEAEVKPGHFAYEEKFIQRITNEFNLYAYDPVTYAGYAPSKAIFERLWNEKKIMEPPVKNYLRNEKLQWSTLINSPTANGPVDAAENISISDYISPSHQNTKGLARFCQLLSAVMYLLAGFSVLALTALFIVQLSGTGRFPQFTKLKSQFKAYAFTIKDSTSSGQVKEIFVRVNDSATTFRAGNTGRLLLPAGDSPRVVTVAVNNKTAFDTVMRINMNSYVLLLTDKPPDDPAIRLTFYMGPDCGDIYKNLDFYRQIATSVSSNIKVGMGPSSGQRNAKGTCLNSIWAGKNVDEKLVNELIERFKMEGIFLERKVDPAYIIQDDAIDISSRGKEDNATYAPPQNEYKPSIYIQVSDQSLVAGAETFRKDLVRNGFTVNPVEIMSWSYNSEIYYFDKVMQENANKIEKLYKSFYPSLPVKATLRVTNDKKTNDNRIVVWMKMKERYNTKKEPVKIETGNAIVDIALGEIGYKEDPPGTNKTKYGEWYDEKTNASSGIAWSGIFVSWVYNKAGVQVAIDNEGKGFSSPSQAYLYFKANGLLTESPVPGDIIIIDLVKGSYQSGIFVKWINQSAGTFESIEGNVISDNGELDIVAKKIRNIKSLKTYFAHLGSSGK